MSELPRGWVEATLDDFCEFENGDRGKNYSGRSTFVASGMPFISAGHLKNGHIDWEEMNYIPQENYDRLGSGKVKSGDFLFCLRGSLGKHAFVPKIEAAAIASSLVIVRPSRLVDSPFVDYYFRSPLVRSSIEVYSNGVAQPNLSSTNLGRFELPLPPKAEQKRIVAKLDALNAKSARARTELARIETLVSRYKQAVLSKAFSGELTTAEGAEASSDRGLGHPPHWRQMHLGEIADIKSGITLGKKRKPDEQLLELPYLRVANVQRGWLDLREMKTVEVTTREAEALFLREGDVLMNEGGDRDKLGRGWVWDGQIADCIHQNHVFRVRLAPGTVPARFLSYYANEFGQKHFFDEGKQTTNLASISKSKLSAMTVPVPPFEEAKGIVRRIESAFARIDRLAGQAKRALELVGKLDDAILAKAFRGELVHQDEGDEPAEKLLERIRAERAAAPKAKRGRGRR